MQLNRINRDDTAFRFRDNNFLQAAFELPSTEGREHQVSVTLPHSSISMVSGNYIYTNSGPIGIGSPGPYVAESVERSYSYNRKKNKGYYEDGIFINKGYWEEEDGEYPYDQILGNWHPDETRKMMDKMAETHKEKIREISFSTLEHLTYVNADTLTKGRQTWCPFTQSSVPSDVAFATIMQILRKNEIGPLVTLADFGLAIMTLWCKLSIETIKCTWTLEPVKQRKRETLQTQIRKRYKKTITWVKIEDSGDNEVFKYVLDMARSFCSYIKHGERGKLKRRAIASPNIIMRVFLYIIEVWHLDFCKILKGATISIGGSEKKCKIMENLADATTGSASHIYTATEDATKFNECMCADGFAFMHYRLLVAKFPDDKDINMLASWFLFGNWILSRKRITLGEGPSCFSEDGSIFNKPAFHPDNVHHFNAETRQWIENMRPHFSGENYLNASAGMLMGMHNAAGTTWSCASIGHRQSAFDCTVSSLRSSDDSMTVFSVRDPNHLHAGVQTNYRALKLIGVNMSLSKTFIFAGLFGEFTSWYMDESFVSQFGTETSGLRPQGKNPHDDFFAIALRAHTTLTDQEVNHLGAEAMLREGVENCRRLWLVKPFEGEEDLSIGVRFLADGGDLPWSCVLSNVTEVVIRMDNARTEADFIYLRTVCNPLNPFTEESKEEYTYDRNVGKMTLADCDEAVTVFQYASRKNRTFRGLKQEEAKNNRMFAAECMDILNKADPALSLSCPMSEGSCSEYIVNAIKSSVASLPHGVSGEHLTLVTNAIARLQGNTEEMMMDSGSDSD